MMSFNATPYLPYMHGFPINFGTIPNNYTFPVPQCSVPFNVIDSIPALQQAVDFISRYDLIAVDCEGIELGRHGILCLLQVATQDHVFIFDVIALGEEIFSRGLKQILESTSIFKIFYDCRGDCDILFHQYDVRVKAVIDLALTEVYYRFKNGMGIPRFFKGYRKCVEMYMPSSDPYFHELKRKVCDMMTSSTMFWKERPLPKEVLEYAAYDVKYLKDLHHVLCTQLAKEDLRVIKKGSAKLSKMTRDQTEITLAPGSPDWARIPSFFEFIKEPITYSPTCRVPVTTYGGIKAPGC